MAILTECDICGNQHRVKDGLGGSSIRCQDCGVQLVVPEGQQITAEAFIEEGGRLVRREPEQAPSIWTWLFVGLVACLMVLALCVIFWLFTLLVRSLPRQVSCGAKAPPLSVVRKDPR